MADVSGVSSNLAASTTVETPGAVCAPERVGVSGDHNSSRTDETPTFSSGVILIPRAAYNSWLLASPGLPSSSLIPPQLAEARARAVELHTPPRNQWSSTVARSAGVAMNAGRAHAPPASIAAAVGRAVVRRRSRGVLRPRTRTVDSRAGAPIIGGLSAVESCAACGHCRASPVWPTRPRRRTASQAGDHAMRVVEAGRTRRPATSPMMMKKPFSSWASALELLTAPPSSSLSTASIAMGSSSEVEKWLAPARARPASTPRADPRRPWQQRPHSGLPCVEGVAEVRLPITAKPILDPASAMPPLASAVDNRRLLTPQPRPRGRLAGRVQLRGRLGRSARRPPRTSLAKPPSISTVVHRRFQAPRRRPRGRAAGVV